MTETWQHHIKVESPDPEHTFCDASFNPEKQSEQQQDLENQVQEYRSLLTTLTAIARDGEKCRMQQEHALISKCLFKIDELLTATSVLLFEVDCDEDTKLAVYNHWMFTHQDGDLGDVDKICELQRQRLCEAAKKIESAEKWTAILKDMIGA